MFTAVYLWCLTRFTTCYIEHEPLLNSVGAKLVVVMIGLPARGKSYIARKLRRYLVWLGFDAEAGRFVFVYLNKDYLLIFTMQIFNVGNHRREAIKSQSRDWGSSDFFNPGKWHPSPRCALLMPTNRIITNE